MTKKYEVVHPWFGVEKGDIVENVGAMFMANVRLVTAKQETVDTTELDALKSENAALLKEVDKLNKAIEAKDAAIKKLQDEAKKQEEVKK